MKIGIIGSNGFIGSNLKNYFKNQKKYKVFYFSSYSKFKKNGQKKFAKRLKETSLI